MSLGLALTSAISSLRVNQEALSLISQNIANAGTEGYTRVVIKQTSEILNGQSAGAKIEGSERAVDTFLINAAQRQISKVGEAKALETFFDRTQLFLGAPGANNSINTFVDNFFSSLSDLANNPEQTFLRNNALDSAKTLTSKISGLANDIEQMRFDVDQEIESTIAELNSLLAGLDNMNGAIKEATQSGNDKNSLLDQRDLLLSQLSEIIEVSTNFSTTGEVTIFINKGELLAPSQKFAIEYSSAPSVGTFINGDALDAIDIVLLDGNGNKTNNITTLVSASNAATQENNVTSGKLKGLLDLRDVEFPKMLDQLDEMADTIKNTFNAIHNDGVGFPPPTSLTGTRTIDPAEEHLYSGKVRIAILDQNGNPVPDSFGTGNLNPLTIDLSRLDSGSGAGVATTQTIIDEINNYFGPPPANKVTLGPLDDIRIASVSSAITSVEASGTIQFTQNPTAGVDTITIDGQVFNFVAGASSGTNIQVKATVADTVAEIASRLNAFANPPVTNATYSANGSTLAITHDTAGDTPNGVFSIATSTAGAAVSGGGFLQGGADVTGTFEFDFEFTNIFGDDATFEVLGPLDAPPGTVTATGGVVLSGPQGAFGDITAPTGERFRTGIQGVNDDTITLDFAAATLEEGDTFTVDIPVRVTDGDGNIFIDTLTYQVTIPDPNNDIKNNRFTINAVSGGGDAVMTAPTSGSSFAVARLVDANGNPVAAGQPGILQITTQQGNFGIAIDEMDGKELGEFSNQTNTATNRGMSHFFGLNDFFETGSALKNSAVNFAIRSDYINDSSRLATGELALSNQPADSTANPVFTYEIGLGSNQLVTRLAALGQTRVSFDAAGTLAARDSTLSSYATEILSFTALKSNNATEAVRQEELLFDGFNDRIKSIGGVNIDEELANTIIFQNNFTASARIVNIVSELFDTLIQAF